MQTVLLIGRSSTAGGREGLVLNEKKEGELMSISATLCFLSPLKMSLSPVLHLGDADRGRLGDTGTEPRGTHGPRSLFVSCEQVLLPISKSSSPPAVCR